MKNKTRSGFLLIMSLGVLFLMIFVATAFFWLAQSGSQTSRTVLDGFRASLLAESGFEYAVAQLRQFAHTRFVSEPSDSWVFYGKNVHENDPENPHQEKDSSPKEIPNTTGCPVEEASFPSFPKLNLLTQINGRYKVASGKLPNSYPSKRPTDLFFVKVIDESAKIQVNDPRSEFILNNLGTLLRMDNLGTRLEHFKKQNHLTLVTLDDLKHLFSPQEWDVLQDYLTDVSWADPTVIRPKPYYERRPLAVSCPSVSRDYHSAEVFRAGENKYVTSTLSLYPGRLALEKRSPVNVNLAPAPVLTALLMNLKATVIDPYPSSQTSYSLFFNDYYQHVKELAGQWLQRQGKSPATLLSEPDEFVKLFFTNPLFSAGQLLTNYKSFHQEGVHPLFMTGRLKEVTLSEAKARWVVEQIINRRMQRALMGQATFYTWQEVIDFLDQLVIQKGLSLEERDLILANVNPNTDLNAFNPDREIYKTIDKSSLLNYTTEWTFGPTGVFEIESLGTIVWEGKIIARKRLTRIIRLFDLYRETSEEDFQKGVIQDENPSGKKALDLYPIRKSEGDILRTFNTRSDGYLMLSTLDPWSSSLYQSLYPALLSCQRLSFPDGFFLYDFYNFFQFLEALFQKGQLPESMRHPSTLCSNPPLTGQAENLRHSLLKDYFKPYHLDLSLDPGRAEEGTLGFWIKFPSFLRPGFYRFITLPVCGFTTTFSHALDGKSLRELWKEDESSETTSKLLPFFSHALDFGFLKGYDDKLDINNLALLWDTPYGPRLLTNTESTPRLSFEEGGQWYHVMIAWKNTSHLHVQNNQEMVSPPFEAQIYFNGRPLLKQVPPSSGVPFRGAYSKTLDVDGYHSLFDEGLLANFYLWPPNDYNFEFTLGGLFYEPHFLSDAEAQKAYQQGRYYAQGDASFLSQPIPIPSHTTLGTVAWTDYRASQKVGRFARFLSLLQTEMADETGRSLQNKPFTDPQGLGNEALSAQLQEKQLSTLRYKIRFRTHLIFQPGEPRTLLSSPLLDDVTLTFIYETPRILYQWEE